MFSETLGNSSFGHGILMFYQKWKVNEIWPNQYLVHLLVFLIMSLFCTCKLYRDRQKPANGTRCHTLMIWQVLWFWDSFLCGFTNIYVSLFFRCTRSSTPLHSCTTGTLRSCRTRPLPSALEWVCWSLVMPSVPTSTSPTRAAAWAPGQNAGKHNTEDFHGKTMDLRGFHSSDRM